MFFTLFGETLFAVPKKKKFGCSLVTPRFWHHKCHASTHIHVRTHANTHRQRFDKQVHTEFDAIMNFICKKSDERCSHLRESRTFEIKRKKKFNQAVWLAVCLGYSIFLVCTPKKFTSPIWPIRRIELSFRFSLWYDRTHLQMKIYYSISFNRWNKPKAIQSTQSFGLIAIIWFALNLTGKCVWF